jgi:hypothetical protein
MMMASGVMSGVSSYMKGAQQKAALDLSASFQDFQAKEDIKRAGMETSALKLQEGEQLQQVGSRANAIIGAQKAAYASQHVAVASGTAGTEEADEGRSAAADALTIRNNAILKAWGIDTGATQEAGQEELTALGQQGEGEQSLILGGAQAWNTLAQIQEESERTRYFAAGR